MRLDGIHGVKPLSRLNGIGNCGSAEGGKGADDLGATFKNAVKKAAAEVNELQSRADDTAVGMATGELEDVHQAMIAMQKAKLALEFTVQVRNKVIEAYQEIMRMQV